MTVDAIFAQALAKSTPAERTAYLDEACAHDLSLRQRVETLLQAHEAAGDFLGKPAIQCAAEEFAGRACAADTQGELPADDGGVEALDFLAPSDKPGALGRLGHYEVLEVIGRGGMGIVLRAVDEKLQRVVAIKVMAAQLATNATARKRFTREAQAAAAVSHDHIVTIHAVEEINGLPYLVMQYVSGMSLQQRLDSNGPLELLEIVRIGMQTAAGLAAAHAHGMIHRDIKPANILLENGVERVKITDFGLARAVADASLTQSGVVTGTPQYMSPEQARGEPVDQRTDLFSLGSLLYAMCTGRPPFRADSSMAVLKRVCEDTPRPIQESNPDIPEWLVALIDKLLAKAPAERFQCTAEVAELLKGHLAHLQHPSVVGQVSNLPRKEPAVWKPGPHRRRLVVAAAVFLCFAAGLSLTEATGVTNVRATVIRIFTPEGTLVVEVDDPGVKVTIEGDGGLVITGAGLQEVRLRPGSYKVQAAKAGKPVRLDQELVTIRRGDKQVVRVSRAAEAIAARPPAGKPESQAFVVLSGKGFERKFDTLAEAVIGASAGDTIEVRGNGPFVSHPITIRTKALTIRAGEGFRPIIRLSPEGVEHQLNLLSTTGPLVLEGLELQRLANDLKAGDRCLVFAQGPSLHIANCRLLVNQGHACVALHAPVCELRNCEMFSGAEGGIAINCGRHSNGSLTMINSLGAGGGVIFSFERPDVSEFVIRLTHNTMVGDRNQLNQSLAISFSTEPKPSVPDVKGTKLLRVEASGNVLDTPCIVRFVQAQPKPSPRVDALARLPHLFAWQGARNLYAVDGAYVFLDLGWADIGRMSAVKRLQDWKHLWDSAENGSLEGAARFKGGDLGTKLALTPEQFTPEDFRLHPDSPGKGAGPGGKDLGADVDLVGPGAAYKRWKTTPAYQQWRKETKQVRTPTPEPEPKAFVILGGKGLQVGKFDTLAEAVTDARDGDTVEIRGNGPFVTPALSVRDKALCIRAGEGFHPVIQMNEEGIKSGDPLLYAEGAQGSLILEGLEMHRVSRITADGHPASLLRADDAPLHVAHCRFVHPIGEKGRARALSLHVRRCPFLQVRNCQFVNPSGDAAIQWVPHEGEKGIVKNCLLACAHAVVVSAYWYPPSRGSLALENNTFATGRKVYVMLHKRPPLGTPADKSKPIHLEARENILGGDFNFWEYGHSVEKNEPMSAQQAENLLQRLILWKEARNLHGIAPGKPFLTLTGPTAFPKKTTRPYSTRAEWQGFWGLEALDSLQGLPVFQGGDLLARARQNPEKLLPEDFRLAPGSPGKGAGPGGKDLGADVDLVGPGAAYKRWKKTPEYQQWRKDTGQLKERATAKAETQAFVILGWKSTAERKLDTLAEAIASAQDGDTIEIRGNGPFVTDPINIGGTRLKIRAAAGFQPRIKLSPAATEAKATLLRTKATLILEGLEFQRIHDHYQDVFSEMLLAEGAPLHAANCRFVLAGYGLCIHATKAPLLAFQNCEFFTPAGQYGVGNVMYEGPPVGKLTFDNCVRVGGYGFCALRLIGPGEVVAQLRHNTIVSETGVGLASYRPLGKVGAEAARVHCEATANIFDVNKTVLHLAVFGDPPEKLGPGLRAMMTWDDCRNLYPVKPQLGFVRPLKEKTELKMTESTRTLADWLRFWDITKSESGEGKPSYIGGDVSARAAIAPWLLTPESFRLAPGSPGKGAGPGGKDLGADVDLVGPGPAYERWQKTAVYQQWLKDTGQVKK